MTFIVRVSVDEATGVTGILERVQTGQKKRFQGLEAIGPLIAQMIAAPGAGPNPRSSPESILGGSQERRTSMIARLAMLADSVASVRRESRVWAQTLIGEGHATVRRNRRAVEEARGRAYDDQRNGEEMIIPRPRGGRP
jgi:hypothetical protein